jgi:GNAT superfamily N-acetyltransferase
MRDDEFTAWVPAVRAGYAEDLVRDFGLSPEAASAKADADTERLLPGGRRPDDHSIFVIEVDGERAGELWLAPREEDSGPCLFIYDISVDEAYRGRGYGKAAMAFAEDEARRRGFDRVALWVGGRNEVARGLYRSLGYEENGVAMSKAI